jgi:hypothetical protein
MHQDRRPFASWRRSKPTWKSDCTQAFGTRGYCFGNCVRATTRAATPC